MGTTQIKTVYKEFVSPILVYYQFNIFVHLSSYFLVDYFMIHLFSAAPASIISQLSLVHPFKIRMLKTLMSRTTGGEQKVHHQILLGSSLTPKNFKNFLFAIGQSH